MNKVFDKIIEKLEEEKMSYFLTIANTGDEKLDYSYEQVGNALDKAIEIVKKEAEKYSTKNCSECSRRKFYQIGYEEGKKYSGWIPCSSGKLPNVGERVLLQDFGGNITLEKCEKKKMIKGFTDGNWWASANNYLAWQPLPEKYQPKGE